MVRLHLLLPWPLWPAGPKTRRHALTAQARPSQRATVRLEAGVLIQPARLVMTLAKGESVNLDHACRTIFDAICSLSNRHPSPKSRLGSPFRQSAISPKTRSPRGASSPSPRARFSPLVLGNETTGGSSLSRSAFPDSDEEELDPVLSSPSRFRLGPRAGARFFRSPARPRPRSDSNEFSMPATHTPHNPAARLIGFAQSHIRTGSNTSSSSGSSTVTLQQGTSSSPPSYSSHRASGLCTNSSASASASHLPNGGVRMVGNALGMGLGIGAPIQLNADGEREWKGADVVRKPQDAFTSRQPLVPKGSGGGENSHTKSKAEAGSNAAINQTSVPVGPASPPFSDLLHTTPMPAPQGHRSDKQGPHVTVLQSRRQKDAAYVLRPPPLKYDPSRRPRLASQSSGPSHRSRPETVPESNLPSQQLYPRSHGSSADPFTSGGLLDSSAGSGRVATPQLDESQSAMLSIPSPTKLGPAPSKMSPLTPWTLPPTPAGPPPERPRRPSVVARERRNRRPCNVPLALSLPIRKAPPTGPLPAIPQPCTKGTSDNIATSNNLETSYVPSSHPDQKGAGTEKDQPDDDLPLAQAAELERVHSEHKTKGLLVALGMRAPSPRPPRRASMNIVQETHGLTPRFSAVVIEIKVASVLTGSDEAEGPTIVNLNVGGTSFLTSSQTLCCGRDDEPLEGHLAAFVREYLAKAEACGTSVGESTTEDKVRDTLAVPSSPSSSSRGRRPSTLSNVGTRRRAISARGSRPTSAESRPSIYGSDRTSWTGSELDEEGHEDDSSDSEKEEGADGLSCASSSLFHIQHPFALALTPHSSECSVPTSSKITFPADILPLDEEGHGATEPPTQKAIANGHLGTICSRLSIQLKNSPVTAAFERVLEPLVAEQAAYMRARHRMCPSNVGSESDSDSDPNRDEDGEDRSDDGLGFGFESGHGYARKRRPQTPPLMSSRRSSLAQNGAAAAAAGGQPQSPLQAPTLVFTAESPTSPIFQNTLVEDLTSKATNTDMNTNTSTSHKTTTNRNKTTHVSFLSIFLDRNSRSYGFLLDTLRNGVLPDNLRLSSSSSSSRPASPSLSSSSSSSCSSSDSDDPKVNPHEPHSSETAARLVVGNCQKQKRRTQKETERVRRQLGELRTEAGWLDYESVVRLCQAEEAREV